ncbi:MAG: bifunctional cytochrome P450/NADPH--P450 reductase [Rubrobacteraceae bacterium]
MDTVEPNSPITYEPIPQPPGYPVVGNIFDLRAEETPIESLMKLARQYGPIYRIRLGQNYTTVLSSFDFVDEVSDDERFDKFAGPGITMARKYIGDGLFTAWTQEPNWSKAHNILLPSFGPQQIRGYLPEMVDIATQLVEKWERLNPDEEINVVQDMTRLTLDTIALCGFDYRLNSFYRTEPHPFVAAMLDALDIATTTMTSGPIRKTLAVGAKRRGDEDAQAMYSLVDSIIEERKASGDQSEKKDLLQLMLTGVDRQTGESLDDVNIRYQVLTMLFAGHETTSGLLSFTLAELLRNPEVLAKAYEEVDRVLGGDLSTPPDIQQVKQLQYVSQILKETLRLHPPAPFFSRYAYEPTVIGGKYQIDKDHQLWILTPMLHRDPKIWGNNVEEFDPDRFTREAEQNRPANAYKPFGTGQRACIGRHFALQEATLVLGMILQRFELINHTNYELEIEQTLTIHPVDFRIKVRPRTDRPEVTAAPAESAPEVEEEPEEEPAVMVKNNTPLLVLYGSNMGTAEGIANEIAEDGTIQGFSTTVAPLDEYVDKLPTEGAVVITASSYNGTPPDNAVQFFDWLCNDSLGEDALKGVKYTVFGCGDHDWAATYQRVPKMIDSHMQSHGAESFYQRGEGDQSDDFDGQYRGWYEHFWSSLSGALGVTVDAPEAADKGPRYQVEMVTDAAEVSPLISEFDARPMEIVANRELQIKDGPNPSGRSTRHIEFALPEGMTYQEGDHLGILPRNSEALVNRVLERFELPEDAHIRIRKNATGKSFLPTDEPVLLPRLLTSYVGLQVAAKRPDIAVLAEYTDCPPEKEKLLSLSGDDPDSIDRYREEVLGTNKSLLDLLEENRSCELPFNIYLELLPKLKPRYYSISSSPLVDPQRCSITVGVVDAPALAREGRYQGVCSNYLAREEVGSVVEGFVRPPGVPFVPPEDPDTPMIMVAAGTGLAPFRGFLQERAALKSQGEEVGPSMVFFGCRNPQQDYIYENELEEFEREDITELRTAFSRLEGEPKMYVQDRILAERDEVWNLLQEGAIVYVCGDAGRMAPAVERSFVTLYQESNGAGDQDAEAWMADLKASERYLVDIWPRNEHKPTRDRG